MSEDDFQGRVSVVATLLSAHSIPEPEYLARRIVEVLDQRSLTSKWDQPRADLLDKAEDCWLPHSDLLAYLNALPGEALTAADLKARMRNRPYCSRPFNDGDRDLQADCLRVFHREKKAGTEILAILEAISDEVHVPAYCRANEQRAQQRAEQKAALLRSGKDFGPLQGYDNQPTNHAFMRRAGQLYRIIAANREYAVFRINGIDDQGTPTKPAVLRREPGRSSPGLSIVSDAIAAGRLK